MLPRDKMMNHFDLCATLLDKERDVDLEVLGDERAMRRIVFFGSGRFEGLSLIHASRMNPERRLLQSESLARALTRAITQTLPSALHVLFGFEASAFDASCLDLS